MEKVRLAAAWHDWRVSEDGLLGEGSYGQVWRIERQIGDFREYCAAKIIRIPRDEEELKNIRMETGDEQKTIAYFEEKARSFLSEIENMVRLKNSGHIVRIEDFQKEPMGEGRIGSVIFIRMELLEDLRSHLIASGLREEEVIRLGLDLCDALEECERAGILHRDIKPQNIFVSPNGAYKLGDFGVARYLGDATDASTRAGTTPYMAPEVYRNLKYDYRSDLYSLGMVMYRLLNRNHDPFLNLNRQFTTQAEREEAARRRMFGEPLPPPADASPGLAGVLLKALAYDPEERYQHASEFRTALERLSGDGETRGSGSREEAAPSSGTEARPASARTGRKGSIWIIPAAILLTALLLAAGSRIPGFPGIGPEPTAAPTAEPTAMPTAEPTATPTPEPTATPTAEPTATPTMEPTATPMPEPTATPTATLTPQPTATPTAEPTATPTTEPTATPTPEPTATPTAEPTATPTPEPTATPTAEPTPEPTPEPRPWSCLRCGQNNAGENAYCENCGYSLAEQEIIRERMERHTEYRAVGETVFFGYYEQDNNLDNGVNGKEEIEWIILEEDETSALLLSRKVLELLAFDDSGEDTSWQKSTIREWLNGEFFETAFSARGNSSHVLLQETDSSGPSIRIQGIEPSREDSTIDAVFLLSPEEVFDRYLKDSDAVRAKPTVHAAAAFRVKRPLETISAEEDCIWWLRQTYHDRKIATAVSEQGRPYFHSVSFLHGIRPAIRVDKSVIGR